MAEPPPPAYDPKWLEEAPPGNTPPNYPVPPGGATAAPGRSPATSGEASATAPPTKEQEATGAVPVEPAVPQPSAPPSGAPYPSYPPPGQGYPLAPYSAPTGPAQDGSDPSSPPLNMGYPPQGGYPPPGAAGYPPPGGAGYPPPGGAGYPPPGGVGYPPPGDAVYPPPDGSAYPPPAGPGYPPPGSYPPAGPYPPPAGPYPPTGPPGGIGPPPITIQPGQEGPTGASEAPDVSIELKNPQDFGEFIFGPEQRSTIDQLEDPLEDKGEFTCKSCCSVMWSGAAHIAFFVCLWIIFVQDNNKRNQQSRKDLEYGRGYDDYDRDDHGYDEVALICGAVFFVVSYLVILIEGCCSDTQTYISNMMNIEHALEYVDSARHVIPEIVWKVECYHYEYHTTTHTRVRNGRTETYTKTEKRRVVTYTGFERFLFRQCIDASGDFKDFKKGEALRVEFEKTFAFTDVNTQTMYFQTQNDFKGRNRGRDEEMDFEEEFIFGDFKDRITIFTDEGSKRTCMKEKYFWLTLCFFCTWPYRWWFRTVTSKRKFTFIKVLGV